MSVRWITPILGTAPAIEARTMPDVTIIDVRDLVDKTGNRVDAVRQKVLEGTASLKSGARTIVCCDYGISRSNAIAAGILATFEKIDLDVAVRRVLEATGETDVKLEPLAVVRSALGAHRPDKRKRRSVLLTGASGFLGVALRRTLAQDEDVNIVAPSREEANLEKGGTHLSLLAHEHAVDCVVHLANPRVSASNVALGASLTMLRNAVDVALLAGASFIFLSGWEIYSGYRGSLIADESLPALPRGPYGEAKYLAEHLIEHCKTSYGLPCTVLRSSPVYGPGSDKPKFLFNFADRARRNETIVTHHYRNGDPQLDLLHIDDLVGAIRLAIVNHYRGVLNLGTGQVTSTYCIAEMVTQLLGSRSPISRTEIDADVACITMDPRTAKEALGWQPTVTLADGLRRLFSTTNT